jgi:2-dehydropantoate 2-reductase
MKILVLGAGAIGCFVGGCLAATGQEVTLVGRPGPMQKIASHGLTLLRPDQPAQTVFPQTATAVGEGAGYDFILLTVKTPDTATAIKSLLALKLDQTWLVSLQNGLGGEEQLAATFGPERVIAGTVTIPIRFLEPGLIEVSKAKGGIGLASFCLPPSTQALTPVNTLATALHQAGLTAVMYQDYRAMKWSKLLLNMINNASCAILDQPPVQIIAQPELFNLEIRALQEAVAVMKAQGLSPVKLPGYPVDWLARLVTARWLPLGVMRAILRPFMLSGRGTKMPSLQLDLASGRPTSEIEALNGAVVRAGQKVGVPTPINQILTEILSQLVSGQLDRGSFKRQPAKLLQAVAAAQGK